MPYHLATPQWEGKQGIGVTPIPSCLGWEMGLEPTTPGSTIRCSNQLSYTHHILRISQNPGRRRRGKELVRQKGLEPLAYCLEGSCSIQLSYWRTPPKEALERVMGIEPTRPAWKAGILPLNYTRMDGLFLSRQP